MARKLLEVPRDTRIVGEDGRILPEWQRPLEETLYQMQLLLDAVDASSGAASGATVDTEWNAFVNALKQD